MQPLLAQVPLQRPTSGFSHWDSEPGLAMRRPSVMDRRATVAVLVGLAVIAALVVAVAVIAPEGRGTPCVDYIPANVGCAIDSPALRPK